jgi:hypothetical protein
VPERLLIAATVILVLDMCKVLKRNGLVRHMLAAVQVGKAAANWQHRPAAVQVPHNWHRYGEEPNVTTIL